MTKEGVIQFWVESSDKDLQTMDHLYASGDYSREFTAIWIEKIKNQRLSLLPKLLFTAKTQRR
jgi:hypothetical protein